MAQLTLDLMMTNWPGTGLSYTIQLCGVNMVNSSSTLATTFQVLLIANCVTLLKRSTPNTRHGNSTYIYLAMLQSSSTCFSPQSTGLISVNLYVVSKSCVSTPSHLAISKKRILCFAPWNRSLSYVHTLLPTQAKSTPFHSSFYSLSSLPRPGGHPERPPHMLCSVDNGAGDRKPRLRDMPAITSIHEFVLWGCQALSGQCFTCHHARAQRIESVTSHHHHRSWRWLCTSSQAWQVPYLPWTRNPHCHSRLPPHWSERATYFQVGATEVTKQTNGMITMAWVPQVS